MGSRKRRVPNRLRSRWLPGYWLRHPLLSLMVLLLAAGVFTLLGIDSACHTYRLDRYGVRAEAMVLQVHPLARSSYVVAEFTTADGQHVVAKVTDYHWDPRPRVGDPATVLYDPVSPDVTVRDARLGGDHFGAWTGIVLSLGFGAGGGMLLYRTWSMWRENAEDWRSGRHFA